MRRMWAVCFAGGAGGMRAVWVWGCVANVCRNTYGWECAGTWTVWALGSWPHVPIFSGPAAIPWPDRARYSVFLLIFRTTFSIRGLSVCQPETDRSARMSDSYRVIRCVSVCLPFRNGLLVCLSYTQRSATVLELCLAHTTVCYCATIIFTIDLFGSILKGENSNTKHT